jgi:hypothetical protein
VSPLANSHRTAPKNAHPVAESSRGFCSLLLSSVNYTHGIEREAIYSSVRENLNKYKRIFTAQIKIPQYVKHPGKVEGTV